MTNHPITMPPDRKNDKRLIAISARVGDTFDLIFNDPGVFGHISNGEFDHAPGSGHHNQTTGTPERLTARRVGKVHFFYLDDVTDETYAFKITIS
jgi:hypothetical protein